MKIKLLFIVLILGLCSISCDRDSIEEIEEAQTVEVTANFRSSNAIQNVVEALKNEIRVTANLTEEGTNQIRRVLSLDLDSNRKYDLLISNELTRAFTIAYEQTNVVLYEANLSRRDLQQALLITFDDFNGVFGNSYCSPQYIEHLECRPCTPGIDKGCIIDGMLQCRVYCTLPPDTPLGEFTIAHFWGVIFI